MISPTGGGNHSKAILERLGEGRLIAFDQDPDAEKNMVRDERLLFVRGNFRYVRNYLRYYGIKSIHGALADLGVSSHHFDEAERGFSFRFDSKIDMRMNPEAAKSAMDILNQYPEEDLKIIAALNKFPFAIQNHETGEIIGWVQDKETARCLNLNEVTLEEVLDLIIRDFLTPQRENDRQQQEA